MKSDALNEQAKERIVFIKDNGKGSLRSYENFYNVSSPDTMNCEDAVKLWYVILFLSLFLFLFNKR